MPSNRREFLKTLASGAAALTIAPRATLLGEIPPATAGSLDFVFVFCR